MAQFVPAIHASAGMALREALSVPQVRLNFSAMLSIVANTGSIA